MPASTSAWAAAPTSPTSAAPSASTTLLRAAALTLLHDARPPRQPLRADRLPAPFHLAAQLPQRHYLTAAEKLRVAWGLACLARTPADADPPFLDWLTRHGQTPRTIDRFWGVVLTSALNEVARTHRPALRPQGVPRRLPAPPPRLRGRTADRPARPALRRRTAGLARAPRRRACDWARRCGSCCSTAARSAAWSCATAARRRRTGTSPPCRSTVCSICCRRAGRGRAVLRQPAAPGDVADHQRPSLVRPAGHGSCRTSSWSIASASGCSTAARWRRASTTCRWWSAPRGEFRGLGHDEVQRRIAEELARLFPAAARRRCCARRVVTEHAATFSAVPGVDRWRPAQASPIAQPAGGRRLDRHRLAGHDGRRRPQRLPAPPRSILARAGRPEQIVRPDLV